MRVLITRTLLRETFQVLQTCGQFRRECQVLWVGPWTDPTRVTRVVHPRHRAHLGGFEVDSAWLSTFWKELGERREGVRVQVHTHPAEAFHSPTDDEWPVVHMPGFLSLVLPNFARGEPGLEGCHLAELQESGRWRAVDADTRIKLT